MNLYTLTKSFNTKSINPIHKYPHIIESYACILQIFVLIFLFPMNFQISFGICSTPKVLHFQHSHIMLSNELLLIHTHQDLLYMLILYFR